MVNLLVCLDVNECLDIAACLPQETCINLVGSFVCAPYIKTVQVASPLTSMLGGDRVTVELQFPSLTKFINFSHAVQNRYTLEVTYGQENGTVYFPVANLTVLSYHGGSGLCTFEFDTTP